VTFSSSSYPSRDPARSTQLRPGIVRRMLEPLIPHLLTGRLQLVLPNGEVIDRRGADSGPDATLTLQRWRGL